ncbi:TPA: hypothetical protein N5N91_004588 [Enterobacter roggenkampii]|nr:hypothetical protein [Enterobacter roggenkampii]
MEHLSYYDSAEDMQIDRKRVMAEFEKHHTETRDVEEFFSKHPANCNEFDAQELLIFLGY